MEDFYKGTKLIQTERGLLALKLLLRGNDSDFLKIPQGTVVHHFILAKSVSISLFRSTVLEQATEQLQEKIINI